MSHMNSQDEVWFHVYGFLVEKILMVNWQTWFYSLEREAWHLYVLLFANFLLKFASLLSEKSTLKIIFFLLPSNLWHDQKKVLGLYHIFTMHVFPPVILRVIQPA